MRVRVRVSVRVRVRARSIAWYSAAGFHQGSIRKMREATVRLSATPPALVGARVRG